MLEPAGELMPGSAGMGSVCWTVGKGPVLPSTPTRNPLVGSVPEPPKQLPLQRPVYRILQICLAADGIAACIDCNVLHAVDFVRRHLRSPLQPVVERDARPDLPGIVEVQAVTIDQRSVREGLGPGQVE